MIVFHRFVMTQISEYMYITGRWFTILFLSFFPFNMDRGEWGKLSH